MEAIVTAKKFRGWDRINKVMVYGIGVSPLGDPIHPGYQWFQPKSTNLHKDIMEYIYIKDKNGNELFKNDTIRGNLFDFRLPIMGTVVYDEEHACYSLKNDAGLTPLYKIDQIEVIGNTFEGIRGV